MVATLLIRSDISVVGDEVVVSWELTDATAQMEFIISRTDDRTGIVEQIVNASIERERNCFAFRDR